MTSVKSLKPIIINTWRHKQNRRYLRHRFVLAFEAKSAVLAASGILFGICGLIYGIFVAETARLFLFSDVWIYLALLGCGFSLLGISVEANRMAMVSALLTIVFCIVQIALPVSSSTQVTNFFHSGLLEQLPAAVMITAMAVSVILLRTSFFELSQALVGFAVLFPLLTVLGPLYGIKGAYGHIPLSMLIGASLCALALLAQRICYAPISYFFSLDGAGSGLRFRMILLGAFPIILGWIGVRNADDLRVVPILVCIGLAAIVYVLLHAIRRTGIEDTVLPPNDAKFASEIEKALRNEEFFLVFQPQVNIVTQELTGVEALVRWRHPQRGIVPPGEFIRVAELSGLIVPIGAWVLHAACNQAASWRDSPLEALKISVNVSALQIKSEGLVDDVTSAIAESGLAPERLVIELTESAIVRPGEKGFDAIEQLGAAGIKLAIDDFGTGYSCLAYLKDIPASYLKIDRSFVLDTPGNERSAAIARAVISIGHTLGYRTIAEGVETAEQADFLKGAWCDEGQGYLYGRPMTADVLAEWAATWQPLMVERV